MANVTASSRQKTPSPSSEPTRLQYWMQMIKRLFRHKSALLGFIITLTVFVVGIAAPYIAPHDPIKQNYRTHLEPPSAEHWLGTDQYGRDVLSRIIHGANIALQISIYVVLIAGSVGVLLGFLAGYYEGWIDTFISRSVDILLAFPSLLLAIGIVTLLGPTLLNALIAVSIARIPRYVRVTRGMVLSQKQRDYIQIARAIGAGNFRIMRVHLFPNVIAPIVVLASLGMATALLATSSLSFLGLGAQPPSPEWGAMLSAGRSMIYRAWWVTLFPGLAIMITVLGINLLGDSLRDILDPKTQER